MFTLSPIQILLQGPPGTGKTQFISNVLRENRDSCRLLTQLPDLKHRSRHPLVRIQQNHILDRRNATGEHIRR